MDTLNMVSNVGTGNLGSSSGQGSLMDMLYSMMSGSVPPGAGGNPYGGFMGGGGSGSDLMSMLASSQQYLSQIADLTRLSNDIGQRSALEQAQYGAQMTQDEALGNSAQLMLNDMQTKMNIEADVANLASRYALQIASKAMETATLIAQFREKTLGLFTTLAEQRTNNGWGRIKGISQNFKF
jgi:hypothetical protein